MNLLAALPASLSASIQKLKDIFSPYTNRVYLVGGCVRDILRNDAINDADIEVYDMEPDVFANLMDSIGAKGVGKSFFVYKWNDIDIALARNENKISSGHTGFEVQICQDEKIASSRRDFTCNALMLGLYDGVLLDFWGGVEDINKKTLRHIDAQKFSEDPLRVLRGVQFASRFGYKIAPETIEIMNGLDLGELSQTRITWELEKLFLGQFYAHGVFAMCKLNLFEKLLHVKLSPFEAKAFARKLLRYKKGLPKQLEPYYWLFILFSLKKIEPKSLLVRLGLGRNYERMLVKTPFGSPDMSDYELLKIAIDRPINSWVGACYSGIVERAKKLGIYDAVFSGGVSVQEVLQDGFCGKDIGRELRRRILNAAKEKSNYHV